MFQQRQAVHRKDYQPSPFRIDAVELTVFLDSANTRVQAALTVVRQEGVAADTPLQLHGENLALKSISLDGQALDSAAYTVSESALTIHQLPARCTLLTEVGIDPDANLELSGLYRSNGVYCPQCEAEGFRRITYYLDRPDNMATFRCTIHADKAACPLLLSNGNRVASGDNDNGTHWVSPVWGST